MTDIYFLVLLMEFTRALDMEIEKKNGFRCFFHRDLAIRKRQNLLPDPPPPPVSDPAGREISPLQMAKTRRRKKKRYAIFISASKS